MKSAYGNDDSLKWVIHGDWGVGFKSIFGNESSSDKLGLSNHTGGMWACH